MIKRLQSILDRIFTPAKPLPAGNFAYQTPPNAPVPYRLHLRLAENGEGVLIVNASTILHLNQTGAEYAYHIIQNTPPEQVGESLSKRYNVAQLQAVQDLQDFRDRIETLIQTPDLDPETFLGFERMELHSKDTGAPFRLDCALTYRLSEGIPAELAPVARVTRELLTDEWKTILKKAWDAGIPQVVFTGGEPTLRHDLPELVAFAESLGQVTGLLTDGLRLSETAYLHQLLQSGLDHVMLLLDPSNEISWEALRDALVEDLFITVHLTMSPGNKDDLPRILPRLAEMGVKSISLSSTSADMETELKCLSGVASNMGLRLTWGLPVPFSAVNPVALELVEDDTTVAGAGRSWLYVEPDGDVTPSQGDSRVLGNLLNDTWNQIWNNNREE